jgi:hypothetical protein
VLNAAYDTQTEAVKGLEVALRLQGAAVDVESKRLQAFASDMQKLTGIGDESTIAMMQRAAMMGVATDQLDDMAKAGIGLGEVMGTSAESGMESMRRATEGNFQQFERTFPAMRQMATDEEKLALPFRDGSQRTQQKLKQGTAWQAWASAHPVRSVT